VYTGYKENSHQFKINTRQLLIYNAFTANELHDLMTLIFKSSSCIMCHVITKTAFLNVLQLAILEF